MAMMMMMMMMRLLRCTLFLLCFTPWAVQGAFVAPGCDRIMVTTPSLSNHYSNQKDDRALSILPLLLLQPRFVATRASGMIMTMAAAAAPDNDETETETQSASNNNNKDDDKNQASDRYDVTKLVGGSSDGSSSSSSKDGGGAGFNQFDPVLTTTGFLSRRFGIVGGLTVFAALFLVEGREIIQGLHDATPLPGNANETVTTASGLQITEVLVGKAGSVPLPGYIIGLRAIVKIGNDNRATVIYDNTTGDQKPVAFKYGQRPFQNIICEGVEEGIRGMKVGGKRILQVPANLAPPGVALPAGVPLVYEIELTEVLSGYF